MSDLSSRRGCGRFFQPIQFLQLLGSGQPPPGLAAQFREAGDLLLGLVGLLLSLVGLLLSQQALLLEFLEGEKAAAVRPVHGHFRLGQHEANAQPRTDEGLDGMNAPQFGAPATYAWSRLASGS